ncbi:ATP-binding protein [Candidatus Xianfuyuplasma coldseepsis]|uniref:histidine kinase n=1 Tax=Candidatus Xianfuyuplasma coldseepsis TaxID=2782163 RepID=A0A7L7KT87_9MOLU|nr:ATP-binding protein [Xianfuyuplasma coldseepsis]QMS85502.1 GHKL domain-containing protein [Xianfuyuplasma coldseepsis]
MKFKPANRIIVILAVLMLVVYTLMAFFVITQEFHHIDSTYNTNLLNITNIIATDEEIIAQLQGNQTTINQMVESYYDDVPLLSLIEIVSVDKIRYSHVEESLISSPYEQDDVNRALQGETYVLTDSSSLGESRKAFVPIVDDDTIIGAAIVEVLIEDINQVKLHTVLVYSSGFGVGFVISVVGLIWLSKRYISELLGFRPDEIALLYSENKSVIEQLNEALISIDKDYIITTINPMLKSMFHVSDDIVGLNVKDVFPYVDFQEIIERETHVLNKYKKIQDLKLLMNAFPLYQNNEVIGATAIFRTHLEVDSLIDQIKGYQQIAEALRSQKHEFQNKLHVVLGLIKMKDYQQAENYIMERVYTTNLASDYYTSRLKDDKVLALFVGKEIQSKEYNATLLLTSDSYLGKKHSPISSDDIVLVLGNLIDNSFEAYAARDIESKRIVVDIIEDDDMIKMTVIDQAGGIASEVLDKMFERGVSTKQGTSRGTGLSLVNEIVLLYQGSKNIKSSAKETKIEIILMKVTE